jgi:rhodanese-related sulfurtransferase
MTINIIVLALVLVTVVGLLFFKKTQGTLTNYTPKQVYEKMQRGDDMILLDVRTEFERKHEYIDGSIHIPMQEVGSRIDELKKFKDKEIIVHCAVGGRSVVTASQLQKLGFKVGNMTGGIKEWIRESLEYKTGR